MALFSNMCVSMFRLDQTKLRSIAVHTGGRLTTDEAGKLKYVGGETRYIHHVNDEEFKFGELFYAVYRMHLRSPAPRLAWYLMFGKSLEDGLVPIENDDSIEMMWCDLNPLGVHMAEVFTQDCEIDLGTEYYLPDVVQRHNIADPASIPSIVESIVEEHEINGEGWVERLEYRCERWYVSAIRVARGRVGRY